MPPLSPSNRTLEAVILAAGQGKRMGSDLPKVLHPVAGRPMVHFVADACREAGAHRLIVVVGYRADQVRQAFADSSDVTFVDQPQQLGTGHAAMMAESAVTDPDTADLLIVAGDMPLLTGSTLSRAVDLHRSTGADATIATGRLPDPAGYGRVIRDSRGNFKSIVEHKDATDAQRAIDEVNLSCYCFRAAPLFQALHALRPDNRQGEYYITDAPAWLLAHGGSVVARPIVPPDEVQGINNPSELAAVDRALRARPAGVSRR